jgi:hypothetical protein
MAHDAWSEPLTVQDTKAVQCTAGAGFQGVCQVTEVAGRQGTATDAARQSAFGDLTEIRLGVPIGIEGKTHTRVSFFRKAGPVDDWIVDQALDLYSRQGCIAEVSGGVFGEGFTPKITVRILMNLADEGRTAFAELSDYRTGHTVNAMLGLSCDWQK